MKNLRQYIGILIAGILLYFLIKPFVQIHTELKEAIFQIHWGLLICSFSAILFYWSAYLYPFATLLRGITGEQVSFRTAFTLFHLANITRYLPGRIWGVVRLLSLSYRFGLSKTATASSLTLHVGIETVLGGLIAMLLLFSNPMREAATEVLETFSGHTMLLTLVVIGILGVVLFCIPKLTERSRAFLKTFIPLLKTSRLWMTVLFSHSLLWLCQGVAFFLFVKSFAPVQWRIAAILTACFAFAWIVGFLSFLTPGGLGIREGLLGVLLANFLSPSEAALIALLCRLWMLSAEMLLAGMAFLLHRKNECSENT